MLFNKLKKILSFYQWEVLLVIVILVVGLPSLGVGWMIVDDGYYLLIEQKISFFVSSLNFGALPSVLVESSGGRFRPALWIYLWITYIFAGNNPVMHHLINFAVSAVIVFLIYKIIIMLTKSKISALISCIFYIFTPFNLENWYRLQTPEPKETLFIVMSLYFIIKNLLSIYYKKKLEDRLLFLSIIPLFFVYFLRETSFVFIVVPVILIIGTIFLKNEAKYLWFKSSMKYFSANIILLIIPFSMNIFLKQKGDYTNNYQIAVSVMVSSLISYAKILSHNFGIFFWLVGISFLVFLLSLLRKRKISIERFFQLAFLGGFISFYLVLLPWSIPLGRYLQPVLLFFVLFAGFEIKEILKMLSGYRHKICFSFLLILYLLVNIFPMINYIKDTINGQKNINIVLDLISKKSPENGRVWWNLNKNEGTVELIMESNLLLNNVYKRSDLGIEYLDKISINQLKKGDLILNGIVYKEDRYYQDLLDIKIKGLEKIETIPHEVKTISFYFPTIKDIMSRLVFKKHFPDRQIFEQKIFKTEWEIYQVI